MEVRDALDQHVRKRLEDTLRQGGGDADLGLGAHGARHARRSMPDRDGYLRLVDAICGDQRVVDMWGRSGAEHALRQWRSLV